MTLKRDVKFALFFLLLNSSWVFAADNSIVLGEWALEMSVQEEKISVNLIITEDSGGLGGTWVSSDSASSLSDVNSEAGSLGQQLANALSAGDLQAGLLGQQLDNFLSGGGSEGGLADQQLTNALSDVRFDGETLTFFRQTQQGPVEVDLTLEGNTLRGVLSLQQGAISVFGRKVYASTNEWPSPYNGVTPDLSFGLAFNNIGMFDTGDSTIYTCVRIFTNGQTGAVGQLSEIDINLTAVSLDEATFQITNFREFNTIEALNENYDSPECSGKFETETGVYTDVIKAGDSVFDTTWSLIDPINLVLQLDSYRELISN